MIFSASFVRQAASRIVAPLIVALLGLAALHAAAIAGQRAASIDCTLIVEFPSAKELYRDGKCDKRASPASTFKLPLAVMGFDAGILNDAHKPAWDYRPEFDAVKRDQKTVDPTIWERDSVVWYSQEITRRLGEAQFADYIGKFRYGNQDVSGEKAKNNGLTHSWLGTSLTISPEEQAQFVHQLLSAKLPVSKSAMDLTKVIIPRFKAKDGWLVRGKTGSIYIRNADGQFDRNQPIGWFVGWAEKGDRRIVFSRLVLDSKPAPQQFGRQLRDKFIAELPKLMSQMGE